MESGRHLKMEKSPVTRTFSIGAICNGTKASDDFSMARRHSSAGIRALLWATSSAKSLGCSTDSQTSHESIFPNILTPDSIPQFTIPALSVQISPRSLGKDTESEEDFKSSGRGSESSASPACTTITSSSSSSSKVEVSDRKAERSVSDPLTKRRSHLERENPYSHLCKDTQHCLDPASRAALSLPHLTKVTTPYGFVTLSQSPQMASEEALLCQTGPRRLNSIKTSYSLGEAACTHKEDMKGNSSHLSGAKKRLSKDSSEPQSKGRLVGGERHASISTSVPASSTPRHPDKLKRRFYHLIKKHFM